MRKSAQITRKSLLDAAEMIVRRDGIAHLTLDAVVVESGVSKGGILYHFPGKQALIRGMLERLFQNYQSMLDEFYAAEPVGPGRWLRAYVRSALQISSEEKDLTSGLTAALATEPELLILLKNESDMWQEKALNDGLPADLAMVILLAADGYWFWMMFNAQPLIEPTQREQVLNRLLELTHPLP